MEQGQITKIQTCLPWDIYLYQPAHLWRRWPVTLLPHQLFKSAGKQFNVQRHDKFSKAINMELYAVLLHFAKCCDLHVKVLPKLERGGGFSKFGQCPYLDCFSKHQPSGPTLSKSQNVRLWTCVSVCVSVCSLLRYRLTVLLPPLPEVGCPIFIEIRNPWGKVMERSGLRYEHFCLKIVKNRREKKVFLLFNYFSFYWYLLTDFLPHFPKLDVLYF
jgi:hypothetical protein